MQSRKSNKGITLIALVISIIVMIMLATVSLNMTIGKNGILTQAQDAKLKQEEANVETEVMSGIASLDTEYYQKVTADTGITIDSIYNMASLAKYINGKINGFNYNKNGTSVVYFTNTTGSYTVKFDKEGNAKTYKGIYVSKYDTIQISMDKNDTIDLSTDDEDIIWIDVSNKVPLNNNSFTKNDNGTVIIKGFKNKGKDNEELVATVIIKDNGVQGNETVDTSNESKIVNQKEIGKNGNNVIAYLVQNENGKYTLDVKGNGAIADGILDYLGQANSDNVEKIVIEEGITSIGQFCFVNYVGTKEISIPSTVKEIKVSAMPIGNSNLETLYYNAEDAIVSPFVMQGSNCSTFFWCRKLKNVIFGDNVKKIDDNMFAYVSSLANVYFSSSVEEIGERAFFDCINLKNIYLGNGIKKIGAYSFARCSSLDTITIPENVTYIGQCAFAMCTNLKNTIYNAIESDYNGIIDGVIPLFFESTVENIIIGEKVKKIPNSIFSETQIKSIEIPNSVENIGAFAFYKCSNLSNVNIGENVEIINTQAFYNTALKEVTIPEKVGMMGYSVFDGCSNLENYNYNAINCSYSGLDKNEDGTVSLRTMIPSNIKKFNIGNNVKVIPEVMLVGNSNITEINIPDNVEEIEFGAFCADKNVTKVTLGKNLKKISEKAFYNLGITEITIPENVTYIEAMAFTCTYLTTVNYNAINAEANSFINNSLYPIFYTNVNNIVIGPKVTNLNRGMFTSTSITSITIPESVTTIESEIGPFAFCKKLTEIRINKPKDSIKGAPWAYGTTGINVIWKE